MKKLGTFGRNYNRREMRGRNHNYGYGYGYGKREKNREQKKMLFSIEDLEDFIDEQTKSQSKEGNFKDTPCDGYRHHDGRGGRNGRNRRSVK